MKAALISNSRHKGFASGSFLTELIAPHVQIEHLFHEGRSSDTALCAEQVLEGSPDLIILWHAEHCVQALANAGHPNVVLIPDYERCMRSQDADLLAWKNVKMLSFSYALQERLKKLGLLTRTFQYYPDPATLPQVTDYSALRGYFSQRAEQFDWSHVRTLIRDARFERFTVNLASDSGCRGMVAPTLRERLFQRVAVTNCCKTQTDCQFLLKNANFFIAPGSNQGVGISFLEAMGMGMAVAAADIPTLNEYITHEVNGYLFDSRSPASLNLSRFRDAGRRARETVEIGHISWKASCPDLLDFLFSPTRSQRRRNWHTNIPGMPSSDEDTFPALRSEYEPDEIGDVPDRTTGGVRTPTSRKVGRASKPLVTVAIVVLNARNAFRTTISSVLAQSYEPLELLVVDGGSVDGTVDVIRQYGSVIDVSICEKDEGPYFAMNKAAQFAAGRWIIFMNAGDWFLNSQAISNALRYAPRDVDFIIGHHLYRTVDGKEELHKASDSDVSWSLLQRGELNGHWLQGIPGHQATFTRAALLREHGYDTTFRIAADHDFFYRMKEKGCSFYHCGIPLSIYNVGGLSAKNSSLCIREWERTCLTHSDASERVREFFGDLLAYDRGDQPSDLPNRGGARESSTDRIVPRRRSARFLEFCRKLRI